MTSYSIGYEREDGDFAVLATLNNNDGLLSNGAFLSIVHDTAERLQRIFRDGDGDILDIQILERQDAPDYVDTSED